MVSDEIRRAAGTGEPDADVGYLRDVLGFHPADTPERREAHERVRALGVAVGRELLDVVPVSPERDAMIERLREVVMWGNAAVALHYPPGSPRPDVADAQLDVATGATPDGLSPQSSAGLVPTAGTAATLTEQGTDPAPVPEAQQPPGPCTSCGRPFSPDHDASAPGPTVRHSFIGSHLGAAAPARNVTEPAEAPGSSGLPPEFDDPDESAPLGAVVPTVQGGAIGLTIAQLAERPASDARWDTEADAWERFEPIPGLRDRSARDLGLTGDTGPQVAADADPSDGAVSPS